VDGAFDGVMEAARAARETGLEFQINTTVTSRNLGEIAAIMNLAVDMGAVAFHTFMLVPTGRAKGFEDGMIRPEESERFLRWLHGEMARQPIAIKATCSPHFYRIAKQAEREGNTRERSVRGSLDKTTRGCLAGIAFCFVSHVGEVYPCGYLELPCGSVRDRGMEDIWTSAEPFVTLRDFKNYRGRCRTCEFVGVCGGCRARAYAVTGDYLHDEPLCVYNGVS
jgi:radical SAM protein with 4Fe4S-binding SPASM domain